jgi:hypothetical protein
MSCPSDKKYLISAFSISGRHVWVRCPGFATKVPANSTLFPIAAFFICIIKGKFFN